MPAPRFHEVPIADKIVELIEQNLSGLMGLKVVTLGALEFFPALEDLINHVPAIFVKPSVTTSERITTAQTYKMTYSFKIVFVKAFGPNEEIVRQKIVEVSKLRELLIDHVNLGDLALQNGQILSSLLSITEWEPAEDNLVATINANMTAVALTFTVEATSRK